MGKTASSYAPTTVDVRSLRSSQGANLRHEESGFWPQGSGPSRSQGSNTNLPPPTTSSATTSSATTSNAKAQDAWRVPSRIYRRATGNGGPPPAGQRRWESNLTLLICRLVTMIANGNNMKPSSTIKAGECTVSQIILCHNQLLNRHRRRECFRWGRIMTHLGALVNLSEEIINLNQSLTTIPHLLVRWPRLITCTFRRSQC